MAENKDFERDLTRLDNDISQIKRDFEIYFAGASKKPPLDALKKLDQTIKRASLTQGLSYAQRFRYNTLAARFNSYRDLWDKQMRAKEEGRSPGGVPPHAEIRHRTQPVVPAEPPTSRAEKIFKDYLTARQQTGETAGSLTYQNFSHQLQEQKKALLEKLRCKDIEFYVAIENGRTKLKARPIR